MLLCPNASCANRSECECVIVPIANDMMQERSLVDRFVSKPLSRLDSPIKSTGYAGKFAGSTSRESQAVKPIENCFSSARFYLTLRG